MTSSENDWILLFGNELKDLLKDSANVFYWWGQPWFTTGGKLVLLQGATLFYYRGNIVLPQGKLVFLQGATLFYYRGQTYFTIGGQPCFTTGGKLVLLQGATLFYYRGQTCFTTGGKLVLPQGTNLFYHREQTCFTTGVNLAKVVVEGGGGGNCINLHKPFDLILLDLQFTMDIITIKSHVS